MFGGTTTTTLTTCIGSGDDTLCRSLEANFTAVGSHTSPVHIRTVPDMQHAFEFNMLLPQSGTLSWDLNQANIALPNWQWNVTSGGNLQNGILTANGPSNSLHTVHLEVYIPTNAPPQRLTFNTDEQTSVAHHSFDLSIHVLQIHRAGLSVIDPQPSLEPHGYNVSTPHQLLIQLENPGNGEDTYEFSASVMTTETISSEDVQFTYYNQIRTLGPLATTIMPLDIELSSTLPAAQPFYLEFEWASMVNKSVTATTTLLIEAEQRHEWNITVVNGPQQNVQPNSDHVLEFNITNIGNFIDNVQLVPSLSLTTASNDTAVWNAHNPITSSMLEVNESEKVSVVQTIPYAWKDANATLIYSVVSSGYVLDIVEVDLSVMEYSEWELNLANSNLEVAPGGDLIQVELEQRGNAPSTPFLTKYGQGWNITLPDGELMEPGQTSVIDIYVEAPENARKGDVSILQIRVSDAVGKGAEVFEVPVRVIGSSSYDLQMENDWYVSSAGGYPLAWIENTGNDMADIDIVLSGMLQGWSANIDTPIQLVPGEIRGIPIHLIPSDDWDKSDAELTVEVTHSNLGTEVFDFTVRSSNISFVSSPVIWGRSNTNLDVEIHNTGLEDIQGPYSSVTDSKYTFSVLQGTNYVNITSGEERIQLVLIGRDTPQTAVACSFVNNAFSDLGRGAYTGDVVSCEVNGDPTQNTKLSFVVSSSRGDIIPIQTSRFTIFENESTFANLSVLDWDPTPGMLTIVVSAYDEYGNVLASLEKEVIAQESGWNVGISSISAQGSINVAVSRTNYAVLENAVCILTVTSRSSDFKADVVIDVAGPQFSPNVRIDASGLSDKEQLDAVLACNTPFDIDDDASDDSASVIFVKDKDSVIQSSSVIWGASVAIVLIGAYLFMMQRQDNALIRTMAKESNAKKPKQDKPSQKTVAGEPTTEETNDVVDDISTVFEQEDDTPAPTMIEEIPVEEDETPSGRLDSLRREMNPDDDVEQQSSIEERMSKFFQ